MQILGLLSVMPFGKYKGKDIGDLPPMYLGRVYANRHTNIHKFEFDAKLLDYVMGGYYRIITWRNDVSTYGPKDYQIKEMKDTFGKETWEKWYYKRTH